MVNVHALMLFSVCVAAALNPVSARAEQIDIPTGVFVALAQPDGPPTGIRGSKHVTWAHNPIDGRLYSMGGDFGDDSYPPGATSSYRQDMYSLSIAERWTNKSDPSAGWRQEYPYCGPDGGIQPKSPDFIGWSWDSNRNVFWMVPGEFVTPGKAVCPDRTASGNDDPKYKIDHVMTFDPSESDLTKRWTDHGPVNRPWYAGENWMSVYDAVTDTIINFASSGIAGIYDVRTKSWSVALKYGENAVGGTIRIHAAALSPDFVDRVVYAVDEAAGRLMRWNMNDKTLDDLGPVPDGPMPNPNINSSFSAWDSANRVLHFFHPVTKRLHVYHPNTASWETPPMETDPPGMHPDVKHAIVYDPFQNVLVFLGNRDPSNKYIYLYRYGNGSGSDGTQNPAPAAPSDLIVSQYSQ